MLKNSVSKNNSMGDDQETISANVNDREKQCGLVIGKWP